MAEKRNTQSNTKRNMTGKSITFWNDVTDDCNSKLRTKLRTENAYLFSIGSHLGSHRKHHFKMRTFSNNPLLQFNPMQRIYKQYFGVKISFEKRTP